MKTKTLRTNAIMMTIATIMVVMGGCKKHNPKEDTEPVFTQLPESAMFVSTFDANAGTTIYVLDAATGTVMTKYKYQLDDKAGWSSVIAGNGFLYDISGNKINAINMNTGKVLWSDAVSNVATPVLHDDTFYGVSANNAGTYTVYALDATKPTKSFLWQAQVVGETRPQYFTGIGPTVAYYNGVVHVLMNGDYTAALDAKTGAVKWQINNTSSWLGYAFTSLQAGFITIDYTIIDAINGTQIATVAPPVIPPSFPQNHSQSSVALVTKESSFIETRHFDASPGWSKTYLSRVDNITGIEKWHINYGGGYVNYDSSGYVSQVWNNRVIIRKVQRQGAGKYGVTSYDSHWLTDINTGLTRLNLEDTGTGLTVSTYIVGSTMYLNKRYENTLHGLPYGNDSPPVDFFLAIDLNTGKQKWNINKLLAGYTGGVSSCVYTGGKGVSPYVQ
jgi:hypothetical protein